MAWPQDPIAADKTDETVTEEDHAAHHNTLAEALNLLGETITPTDSTWWQGNPGAEVVGENVSLAVRHEDMDTYPRGIANTTVDGDGWAWLDLVCDTTPSDRTVAYAEAADGYARIQLAAGGEYGGMRMTADGLRIGDPRNTFPGGKIGFFNAAPITRPTISGSLSSSLADVVADLLSALHNLGLITNETTP